METNLLDLQQLNKLKADIEQLDLAPEAVITERSTDQYGNRLKRQNEDGEDEYIIDSKNQPEQPAQGTVKNLLGRSEGTKKINMLPKDYR